MSGNTLMIFLATALLPSGFQIPTITAEPASVENVDVFVVHMTGASIVKRAVEKGKEPFQECLDYYTGKSSSVHYLLGYDGRLFQMTDEHLRVGHVGIYSEERNAYLSGAWEKGVRVNASGEELGPISETTVAYWHESWPMYTSPQHLFRTRSVNNTSVGVEMPPCGYYRDGGWTPFENVNRHEYTRHTVEQHIGVAALACDIAERWGWPDYWWEDPKGGPRSPHIVGHEDVDLFGRSDRGGGWDPGYLRDEPRWDWDFVYTAIKLRKEIANPVVDFMKEALNRFL